MKVKMFVAMWSVSVTHMSIPLSNVLIYCRMYLII